MKINNYVLLPFLANWDKAVELKLQWETELEPSLRGNEQRASFRSAPRATCSFVYSTQSVEEQEALRQLLAEGYQFTNGVPGANLNVGKFCAPIHGLASWVQTVPAPNQVTLFDTVWPWSAGDWVLAFDEAGEWAAMQIASVAGNTLTFTAAPGVTLAAEDALYPLLYGRLELGEISHDSAQHADVPISIVSNTFALAGASPWGNYQTRPLLSIDPDWSRTPARKRTYDLRQQQIGFGAESWEPQQQWVTAEFRHEFTLMQDDSLALMQFLLMVDGRRTGFWLPSVEEGLEITSVLSATVLNVQNIGLTGEWNSEPCVDLFFRYADDSVEGARIQAVAEVDNFTEMVTLEAALAGPVSPQAFVRKLYYVRLNSDEMTFAFDSEGQVSVAMTTRELPFEYSSAELGERPVYLYRIWKTIGGVTTTWRYTSHDVAVSFLGHTYQPAPISHGQIEQSTTADRDDITIDTFLFPGSPFADYVPYPPQLNYYIEITEIFLDSAIYGVLFTGEIRTPKMEGKKLTATASVRLTALNRSCPRFFIQKCCNLILYSPRCGVNAAAYTMVGTLTAIAGRVVTINSAFVDVPDAYFTWGRISVTAPDGSREYRHIRNDARIDATHRQLVLQNVLINAVVGSVIQIEAGCDLRPSTCDSKFSNLINFGGFPFMPASNPTLKAIKLKNPSAGKGGK